MSPIRRNGIYYTYIPTQAGGWKLRTTQTGDATVYRGMKRLIVQLRDERRWALLGAIVNGRLSLGQVYDAHVAKALDALEASLSASQLSAHVPGYLASLRALGRAGKYVDGVQKKLESFIASTPIGTTADCTLGGVTRWTASLGVTPGTRRQYLYAVTGFARYLVRVATLHGTKTAHRLVHEGLIESWAMPFLREHLTTKTTNALLWELGAGKPGEHGRSETPWYSGSGAGHHHESCCEALKIEDYTLKDARHSVAVRMARAGYTPFEIAEQLGTSADLVASTYARFIVKMERRVTPHVTEVAK